MPRKKREWARNTAAGIKVRPSKCVVRDNPRTQWDPERFAALVEDIRRNGVRDPIEGYLMDDHVEVTDGQRRLAAVAELARQGHVIEWLRFTPAKGNRVDAIISGLARVGTREPLCVADEINALDMLDAKGLTEVSELAERLPWSKSKIRQRVAMRQLCERARKALREGAISHNRALQLAGLSEDKQAKALDRIEAKASDGSKTAGRAAPRAPAKRTVRKLADEYRASLVIAGGGDDEDAAESAPMDVPQTLFAWFSGAATEAEVRKALGLPQAD